MERGGRVRVLQLKKDGYKYVKARPDQDMVKCHLKKKERKGKREIFMFTLLKSMAKDLKRFEAAPLV